MRFILRLSSPARLFGHGTVMIIALGLATAPARARLVQADLARVALAPPAGARAPLDLAATDAGTGQVVTLGSVIAGRTVLLLPVDYTCGNVCDPMVSMSVDALAATGLTPDDYALVLIGIDPRDDAAAARRMLADTLGDRAAAVRPRALIVSDTALSRITTALGYTAIYDAGTDSFAHPAAALLLAGDGRVARVLSPLALTGRDLRLTLTEAGNGRIGSLADRLTLLCYGYDAARGVYTPLIQRILTVAGIVTILAIGLLIVWLTRHARRRAA